MLNRRSLLAALAGSALAFASAARAEGGLKLVMVEEPGCPWCARWNAEIGPIYPKTDEGRLAPLRRIDIREITPATLDVSKRVVFTPTFVLVRDGAELGRIEGYPGEELFWWFLDALMTQNDLNPGGVSE
jgi:hypothetical protein